jgi:hypothetical protein
LIIYRPISWKFLDCILKCVLLLILLYSGLLKCFLLNLLGWSLNWLFCVLILLFN